MTPRARLATLALLVAAVPRAAAEEGDAARPAGDAPGAAAALPGAGAPDAAPDAADEDDADLELVVEARGGVPRVAGSAYVVDEQRLAAQELDDIGRVLVQVPGVYVRNEDGYGLRPNIGMRGANPDRSSKVALLEDGVPFGPAPYAAPAAYYFPMTTRLAGVEVFKGPAAIRHGPQTIGGAVNVLSRPVPEGPAGYLDAAIGLRETVKLHGWAGTATDRAGLVAEVAHLGTGGFKQLDAGGPTGFERQDVLLKASVTPDAARRHRLTLKVGYGRERSNETYLGLTRADFEATPYRRYAASADDVMRWQRTASELAWDVDAGAVTVHTVAWHHYLRRTWDRIFGFADGPDLFPLLNGDDPNAAPWLAVLRGEVDSTPEQRLMFGQNHRVFHSAGVQTRLRHEAVGKGFISRLEVGAQLVFDDVTRLHSAQPSDMVGGRLIAADLPREILLDSHTTALGVAGHVTEDLTLGRARVIPGARVEVVRTLDADGVPQTRVVPLPGLGALVDVTPTVTLFGGVHRGFSPVAPGATRDTRPETAWNGELGLRWTPSSTWIEVVGFISDYDNLVGQCTLSGGCAPEDLDRQFSAGRVLVWGAELLGRRRFELPHRLSLTPELAYTYTGSSFRTGFTSSFPQLAAVEIGDALPAVPVHQGALRLVFEHPRGSLTAVASLVGASRDVAGQGPIPADARIPTSVVVDLAADVRVTAGISTYLSITNLGNSVWLASLRPSGARPQAPIQGVLGVKVQAAPKRGSVPIVAEPG